MSDTLLYSVHSYCTGYSVTPCDTSDTLIQVKKPILTAGVAATCCTIGLVFTTGAGEYWLTLFDSFGATGLTFIAFTELVSVMYVYGHERFTRDITLMTGVRPGIFWQITWR